MVMDHEKQRARYVAGTEGAPPVPPPGGYRNARRASEPCTQPRAVPGRGRAVGPRRDGIRGSKRPANALGWIALVAGILFAVILLDHAGRRRHRRALRRHDADAAARRGRA